LVGNSVAPPLRGIDLAPNCIAPEGIHVANRNVLWIMCDQLRFDYLSCYGHPHLQTPNIDALAARGMRFTRAYVQSPVCGPSRMSYYTGRYMRSHGANWNRFPLRVGEPTLGDHLAELGVRNVLVGKTHMQADTEGMRRLGIDPASSLGVQVAECGFEPYERDDGLNPLSLLPGIWYHPAGNSWSTVDGYLARCSTPYWCRLERGPSRMPDRRYVEKAAESGSYKVLLLTTDPVRYLVRSLLAGMYSSIVVFVYWTLVSNLHDSAYGKVIASGFFGVGLSMIVLTNTELFTSNNLYLAISSYEGTTTWRQTLLLWATCYVGNLTGAIVVAGLLHVTGNISDLPPDHALYTGAEHKVHEAALAIFARGILANWIVCLAVRIALRCHEELAKILVLVLVVFIFLYLGGEHSIANMGTFAVALLGHSSITLGEAVYNVVFATAGNIVGGVLLMALPFAYINPRENPELVDLAAE
jgi:nitrite transporter NirC